MSEPHEFERGHPADDPHPFVGDTTLVWRCDDCGEDIADHRSGPVSEPPADPTPNRTLMSRVTGFSPERIDELGGVPEGCHRHPHDPDPQNCYRCYQRKIAEMRRAHTYPPCPDHREVQHRDGNPPWCKACGWNRGRPAVPPVQVKDRP